MFEQVGNAIFALLFIAATRPDGHRTVAHGTRGHTFEYAPDAVAECVDKKFLSLPCSAHRLITYYAVRCAL